MDSVYDDKWLTCRIAPFGNLRIAMYLPFPAAYRSLSRPSSAPSAKAFALRPFSLDLSSLRIPLSSRIILSLIWFLSAIAVFYPNFHLSKLYFAFLPLLSRLYSVFKVLLRGLHYLSIMWWAQMGSNHRPRAYQARALAY